MKRIFIFALGMLLSLPSVCQQFNVTDSKGRRQGEWKDYYPNGQVRYEGQFKNDKCIGTFRYYDEQGNLQATNEFNKSGDRALNKTFASNGRLIATGYYLNQKKDGEWKYYDKISGQLILVEDNTGGMVNGWSRLYNPSTGVLAEERQYVNGQPEGQCRKYSDTGILIMECRYHNGLLDGPTKTYFPSSVLKEQGNYTKGQKSGIWKTYNEDGDIIAEDAFGEQEIR